jgi:cytochrome b561
VTAAPEPGQFTALTRVLHWLTAVLVFCALFIGFVMVNSVREYSTLIMIHRTLGVTILVVVLVRLVNRLAHRAPPLPSTVGALERKIVVLSEVSLYGLLLLQPLSVGRCSRPQGDRSSCSAHFSSRASHRSTRSCFGCCGKFIRSSRMH